MKRCTAKITLGPSHSARQRALSPNVLASTGLDADDTEEVTLFRTQASVGEGLDLPAVGRGYKTEVATDLGATGGSDRDFHESIVETCFNLNGVRRICGLAQRVP